MLLTSFKCFTSIFLFAISHNFILDRISRMAEGRSLVFPFQFGENIFSLNYASKVKLLIADREPYQRPKKSFESESMAQKLLVFIILKANCFLFSWHSGAFLVYVFWLRQHQGWANSDKNTSLIRKMLRDSSNRYFCTGDWRNNKFYDSRARPWHA